MGELVLHIAEKLYFSLPREDSREGMVIPFSLFISGEDASASLHLKMQCVIRSHYLFTSLTALICKIRIMAINTGRECEL